MLHLEGKVARFFAKISLYHFTKDRQIELHGPEEEKKIIKKVRMVFIVGILGQADLVQNSNNFQTEDLNIYNKHLVKILHELVKKHQ